MNKKIKEYLSLLSWIVGFVAICAMIGRISNCECCKWTKSLNISSYSLSAAGPAIVWTIFYIILAVVGWLIWRQKEFKELKVIKYLYIGQMAINIAWMPIMCASKSLLASFLWSILNLIVLDILFMKTYKRIKSVGLLLAPYLLWICYTVYLHYYLWRNN